MKGSMTMQKTLRTLLALVALAGFPVWAAAQTQIDHTTFSVAVTATATNITLTAASGSGVGDRIYADGELMQILSAVGTSTTNWNVRRGLGQGFTPARAHSTNA